MADNPETIINLKAFHCKVINDHKALEKEVAAYQTIPAFKLLNDAVVQRNYQQMKQDVQDIVESEIECILNNPAKKHIIIQK